MTLPDSKLGYDGQNFQVAGLGKSTGVWETIGWTNDPSGGSLAEGARLHPGIAEVVVQNLRCRTRLIRGCDYCASMDSESFAPPHNGSPLCRSGSLASGGRHAHCACNTCF